MRRLLGHVQCLGWSSNVLLPQLGRAANLADCRAPNADRWGILFRGASGDAMTTKRTLFVHPNTELWPLDEACHLLAELREGHYPEFDPQVPKDDLLKVISLKGLGEYEALTKPEIQTFIDDCARAGLPPIGYSLKWSEWGQYLEAGNSFAKERGWEAALMPPADPHSVPRVMVALVATQYLERLNRLINAGTVFTRLPSGVPNEGLLPDHKTFLDFENLKKLANDLNLEVDLEPETTAPELQGFVTKKALIDSQSRCWPTVQRDIQDASSNGLSQVARHPKGRGWNEAKAIQWSKARGKYSGDAMGLKQPSQKAGVWDALSTE